MILLFIHSSWVKYQVNKETKISKQVEKKSDEFNSSLVVKICAEKEDEDKSELFEKTVKEIKDVSKKLKENHIVLFPFVHLSDKPSSPDFALKFVDSLYKELEKDYSVDEIPFGWVKKWGLETKGHPLSVLSRRF